MIKKTVLILTMLSFAVPAFGGNGWKLMCTSDNGYSLFMDWDSVKKTAMEYVRCPVRIAQTGWEETFNAPIPIHETLPL